MRHGGHHPQAEPGNLVGGDEIELPQLGQLLQDARAHAAADIIEQELAASPHVLHHAAKHPQGEHVEEDVLDIGMHEHVGEKLIEMEVLRHEEMEAKEVAPGDD